MICKYCNQDRSSQQFQIAARDKTSGKIYYRRKCTPCKIKTQDIRRLKIRDFVREFKKGKTCSRCGFSDPRALAFHHIDKKEKVTEVAEAANHGWGLEKVMKEIGKCEIICMNCHTIHHFEEREFDLLNK